MVVKSWSALVGANNTTQQVSAVVNLDESLQLGSLTGHFDDLALSVVLSQ